MAMGLLLAGSRLPSQWESVPLLPRSQAPSTDEVDGPRELQSQPEQGSAAAVVEAETVVEAPCPASGDGSNATETQDSDTEDIVLLGSDGATTDTAVGSALAPYRARLREVGVDPPAQFSATLRVRGEARGGVFGHRPRVPPSGATGPLLPQDDGSNIVPVDRAVGIAVIKLPATYQLPQPLPRHARPQDDDVVILKVDRKLYLTLVDPSSQCPVRIAPCRYPAPSRPARAVAVNEAPRRRPAPAGPSEAPQPGSPSSPAPKRRRLGAARPSSPPVEASAGMPVEEATSADVFRSHVDRQRELGWILDVSDEEANDLYLTLVDGLIRLGVDAENGASLSQALQTVTRGDPALPPKLPPHSAQRGTPLTIRPPANAARLRGGSWMSLTPPTQPG